MKPVRVQERMLQQWRIVEGADGKARWGSAAFCVQQRGRVCAGSLRMTCVWSNRADLVLVDCGQVPLTVAHTKYIRIDGETPSPGVLETYLIYSPSREVSMATRVCMGVISKCREVSVSKIKNPQRNGTEVRWHWSTADRMRGGYGCVGRGKGSGGQTT